MIEKQQPEIPLRFGVVWTETSFKVNLEKMHTIKLQLFVPEYQIHTYCLFLFAFFLCLFVWLFSYQEFQVVV